MGKVFFEYSAKFPRHHISILATCLVIAGVSMGLSSFFIEPQKAEAITCGAAGFVDIGGGVCRGFLISAVSWTVPSDWNNSNNTIEVISGGGGAGGASGNQGGGGGGGAYSKTINLTLTPGGSAIYAIGAGGPGGGAAGFSGGDTYFNGASCDGSSVCARGATGGTRGDPGTGGPGGAAASGVAYANGVLNGVGSVKYSGGRGSNSVSGSYGGGGGGAAGPSDNGVNATSAIGGAGDGGSGGIGGAAGNPPGAGGNGTEFSGANPPAYGSGGGGGGVNASVATVGGAGGNYGGGGGGARYSGTTTGGAGKQGIIVITYTPSGGGVPGTPGTPTFASVAATSMTVNWNTASGATSYRLERCTGSGCSSFAYLATTSSPTYNNSGLTVATSYNYRVRGWNSNGYGSYSSSAATTTLPGTPPTVTTNAASAITQTTATLNGNITATGGANATVRGFARGTTSGLTGGSVSTTTENGSFGTGAFSTGATLLSPNTTYYVRAYATNPNGTGYGSIQSFTASASDCTFDGSTVNHGSSVTAYQTASVPFGSSCVSESRTCTNGTLSGSYAYASCSVGSPPGVAITGYAWSDTIGWVSLSGSNYGLYIATSTDTVSGYAWSDNIGWVSANSADLSGCPQSPCTARIVANNFLGWLRALSGGTAESGGWDGFIALGDTNTGDSYTYGISLASSSFSGYAWGSTNVGWLSFNYASTTFNSIPPCEDTQGYFCDANVSKHRDPACAETVVQACTYICAEDVGLCVPAPAPNGTLTVSPRLISPGNIVVVSWEIADAVSCTVTEDNALIDDSWSGVASASASCSQQGGGCLSSAIPTPTTYTLTCQGAQGTLLTQEATVSMVPGWEEL